MKIEVFKLYDKNNKLLDTISVPTVSYKSAGFQPDGKFNSGDFATDGSIIDNKFDSKGGEYNMNSTVGDIVIHYAEPSLVKDHSIYTGYKNNGTASVNIKLEVFDSLGLDCNKFQIGFFYGTENEKILYESKHIFDTSVNPPPQGNINWNSQLNTNYDGPLKPVIEAEGETFITCNADSFISKTGTNGNYLIDFNFNFSGSEDTGALGMVYNDLSNSVYSTYLELNAGSLFIKLWDLAGNEYVFTGLKPLILVPWSLEEFADLLEQLELYFYDTYPSNLFLADNVIGKTTILVRNANTELTEKYSLSINIQLEQDSLGYLVPTSRTDDSYETTEEVDGIDSVGYVKAFAYLESELFDSTFADFLKSRTIVYGSLGEWIKECIDNTRKIKIDKYVPEFAKGSKFHDFMTLLGTFINTAWCPLENNCKIGLLEKISRIGDFNDVTKIEYPAISCWAEERGSELDFDLKAIDAIQSMSRKYNNFSGDTRDCIRLLYSKLPHINMYKGTINCFKILFNTLGINAEVIPLWCKKTADKDYIPEYFYEKDRTIPKNWNKEIDDTYYLSSHIELKVYGYLSYDLIDIASSLVKLAKSVLPVVRVIEHLLVEETSLSTNKLSLGYFDSTKTFTDNENVLQCISFLWNTNDVKYKILNDGKIELRVPQIAKRSSVDMNEWWRGYNLTGIVSSPTNKNNKTLNAVKFFNMLRNTLKNSKLYTYADYANKSISGELSVDTYYNELTPATYSKMDVIAINWESGYVVLTLNSNSLDSIARLKSDEYIQFTFIFNRIIGLCYTTDLFTAVAVPTVTSSNIILPGYKPYNWTKYKSEVIQ